MCYVTKYSRIFGVEFFQQPCPGVLLSAILNAEKALVTRLQLCNTVCDFRAWSVRYNHFHDQLLLTSSSDSRVILNNIVSLSSEPFGHLDDEDEEDGMQDKGSVSF